MTEQQDIPQTPTEIAKRCWDTAMTHLERAADENLIDRSNAYCRIGELALNAAQFALNNPGLLAGVPDLQAMMPTGAPPLPGGIMPPRIWGA